MARASVPAAVTGRNGAGPDPEPVGVRLERVIAATGLTYKDFAVALAGERGVRAESKRRQLRRWRIGTQGLEPATATGIVAAANRLLKPADRFPPGFLVDVEQPKATLERLDMKLDLVLAKLDALEELLR